MYRSRWMWNWYMFIMTLDLIRNHILLLQAIIGRKISTLIRLIRIRFIWTSAGYGKQRDQTHTAGRQERVRRVKGKNREQI